jgi:hypothetical protein
MCWVEYTRQNAFAALITAEWSFAVFRADFAEYLDHSAKLFFSDSALIRVLEEMVLQMRRCTPRNVKQVDPYARVSRWTVYG